MLRHCYNDNNIYFGLISAKNNRKFNWSYPTATRFELTSKMLDDRSKGIDGHNPSDKEVSAEKSDFRKI